MIHRKKLTLLAIVCLGWAWFLTTSPNHAQQFQVPSSEDPPEPTTPPAEPRFVQEDDNPFPETPRKPSPRPENGRRKDDRDPTTVSPELRPLLNPTKGDGDDDKPVEVQLRGRISMGDQPTIGILRVGETMHIIREGTRINVGNPPKSLVVKKLTATSAEVELEYLNNRVIDLQ